MKIKLISLLTLALTVSSQAVVTLSFKNWTDASLTGATGALPICESNGVPISNAAGLQTVWGSAGYFTSAPNFLEDSAATILSLFVPLDNVGGVGVSTRPGLFNIQEYNDAAATNFPAGFSGKDIFIIFGNALNVKANSTMIAVFDGGATFSTFTTGGAQSITFGINAYEYGKITPLTAQPQTGATPSAFVNGVQLSAVAVPEPSAALLGALGVLGLLRRRRI